MSAIYKDKKMQNKTKKGAVEKVLTGIRGFDEVLDGIKLGN